MVIPSTGITVCGVIPTQLIVKMQIRTPPTIVGNRALMDILQVEPHVVSNLNPAVSSMYDVFISMELRYCSQGLSMNFINIIEK